MAPTKPTYLLQQSNYTKPVIALYDAPAETPFADIRELKEKGHVCMFAHYKNWMNGKTLKITGDNFGCGGCGTWLFGQETKSRQEYIEFLAGDEGLKANHELMGKWFDNQERYSPEYGALFVGPYDEHFSKYIKSVTFFINPDQLSVFLLAANYFFTAGDPEAVKAPFGSGCLELLPLFDSHNRPQAILGATDLAMRQYLPPDILAFTVNMPMYRNLCRLDENSFLSKPFLQRLRKARGGEV
ncbi:MAG: DUF169 domain-containing protein [Bacteroidales bacterium]